MPMYAIYDRETGDVLHVHLSPGPLDLGDEVIEDLVASGRIGRAAFVEVDPARVPVRARLGWIPPRPATRLERAPQPPLREAV